MVLAAAHHVTHLDHEVGWALLIVIIAIVVAVVLRLLGAGR
jgi:hypothetical protein